MVGVSFLVKGGILIRSLGFVDVAVHIFCVLGMFVGLICFTWHANIVPN